jgi:D-glycero-beta-D-manno-heptose 1-phosphate adenylyltransferase
MDKLSFHRSSPAPALMLHWSGQPVAGGAGTVVATGVFDLLHVGHLRFLDAARRAGERLVIGVEDDQRTHARKGFGRPIVPAFERAELLAAMRSVDGVFVISGPSELPPGPAYAALLAQLAPATLAFTEGDPAEPGKRAVARAVGAGVHVVSRVGGRSTTLLVEHFTTSAPPATADLEPLERLATGAVR